MRGKQREGVASKGRVRGKQREGVASKGRVRQAEGGCVKTDCPVVVRDRIVAPHLRDVSAQLFPVEVGQDDVTD